jgi:diguanylate cyclase (GGDEF)-like protein
MVELAMSANPPVDPRHVDASVSGRPPEPPLVAASGRARLARRSAPTPAPMPSPAPDPALAAGELGAGEPMVGESTAALFARQLEVLQAASARLSRAEGPEAVGRAVVEETGRIVDYHNARVYVLEPSGDLVPIAFEGRVGAYEKVDLELLRTRLGVGFTGWVGLHGEALLVRDANDDPRGASIPGTDDVDESMLVVPMRYDDAVVGVITLSKLGLDQFDGHDLRLLSILADQAATALESARNLARSEDLAGELRLLLDVSGELAASLDSNQVANILARHLASVMGVEECAISWWDRANDRVASIGYYPPIPAADLTPFFGVADYPLTKRVLEDQATILIDTADPAADRAEVALLVAAGHRGLVMLPLIASGDAIGLVELISTHAIDLDDDRLSLSRTIANEASIALENARLYEEARALADRDPLTGFFNHRYLHERFGQEAVRARRSHRPLSLLMLDLDDFKLVNDSFGHLLGDDVLRWTAELIRKTLRASDVPARYGGDEFAILLPDADHDEAAATAARLRDAFASGAFSRDGRLTVPVGVSIGAATFPADGRTAAELIAVADAGLYRVKRSARRTTESQTA